MQVWAKCVSPMLPIEEQRVSALPRTLRLSVTRKAYVPGGTGDVWLCRYWWGCWGMVCFSKGRAVLWDMEWGSWHPGFLHPTTPAHRFVPVSICSPLQTEPARWNNAAFAFLAVGLEKFMTSSWCLFIFGCKHCIKCAFIAICSNKKVKIHNLNVNLAVSKKGPQK